MKLYHSAMLKWDKNPVIQAFGVYGKENIKCTIFVTSDVYSMSINNPDIRMVI